MELSKHRFLFFFITSFLFIHLFIQKIDAQLIWEADTDKPWQEVFNNLNFEGAIRYSPGTGSIVPATDPIHGKIWRVYKPAADKRSEIRGAAGWSYHVGKGGSMEQGTPYYIGWRYKFNMPHKQTGGWACFQWKSYPDSDDPDSYTQNYPLHMSYNGRELVLTKHSPGWRKDKSLRKDIWRHPVKIGTWVDVVLVINPSIDEKIGYVELYFNGKHQSLLTGGTRVYHKTMDGLEVAPKWGCYNKACIGTEITVDLAHMRVAYDLASAMPKPVKLNNEEDDIKILECIEVDSVTSDFPVSFRFMTVDDWQFIAYYNKHRNLTVASRKTDESSWKYKILPTKVGWDSHNSIVLTMDRDQCLHLSGNMHNDTLIYFKSKKPFDISTLKRVYPMVNPLDELRCTYPNFIKNAEAQLIYSYRKGGSGNGITISNIYDEKTQSFKRLTDKPLFDGLGEMSAYASGPRKGPDNRYHMVWVWRNTPACETNHSVSYARTSDLVHWENIKGEETELPITPRSTMFTVDPVPPKGGAINGMVKLFFDTDQEPLLAYMKYDSKGNSQIFIAREKSGLWESKQISNWDYRWDFTGPGSMKSEIRLNGTNYQPDGKIRVQYWHIKKGNGELVVDANSLSLVEDRAIEKVEQQVYPADLVRPGSGIEGMSVKWIKNSASGSSSDYYALRWETMGKRRFYEAPDVPVKPSSMKLYRLSKK